MEKMGERELKADVVFVITDNVIVSDNRLAEFHTVAHEYSSVNNVPVVSVGVELKECSQKQFHIKDDYLLEFNKLARENNWHRILLIASFNYWGEYRELFIQNEFIVI